MHPAYERDPFAATLESRILRRGEAGGRPFLVLEDTVCYPEGGGQPCALGTKGGGAGKSYQGKAPGLAQRAEALARLAEMGH